MYKWGKKMPIWKILNIMSSYRQSSSDESSSASLLREFWNSSIYRCTRSFCDEWYAWTSSRVVLAVASIRDVLRSSLPAFEVDGAESSTTLRDGPEEEESKGFRAGPDEPLTDSVFSATGEQLISRFLFVGGVSTNKLGVRDSTPKRVSKPNTQEAPRLNGDEWRVLFSSSERFIVGFTNGSSPRSSVFGCPIFSSKNRRRSTHVRAQLWRFIVQSLRNLLKDNDTLLSDFNDTGKNYFLMEKRMMQHARWL